MTGRDIFNQINDIQNFVLKALEFNDEKILKFDTKTSALEFLSLYAVLIFTTEDKNEDNLLKTYNYVKSTLEKKGKISAEQFLSNPKEKFNLILQNDTCLKVSKI